jgi:hypothetical protein
MGGGVGTEVGLVLGATSRFRVAASMWNACFL